jgi:type II secretory pathway predicted ATPase ExeA/cell division septation protein DedD
VSMNSLREATSIFPSELTSGAPASPEAPENVLTYEPFFGLTEKPFSLDADPRFIYDSPTHEAARKNLLAGIRRREGLLVLTGEIGTGKTTLCRAVLGDLGHNTYSSLVPDPFAAREDLLKMLLVDFGIVSIQELTAGRLQRASRTELGFLLSEFLNSLGRDAFAVVIIDEAQNLSLPLIEETRILFDTFGARGRLQILFVGQPELHAKLKVPEMRQVDQRVCGYHRLMPLAAEAVAGYVQHRLHVAGLRTNRVLFPPPIVDALHRRTGGVPRLINRVCDRALHLASELKADTVDQTILDTALIEVGSVTLSPTWDAILYGQQPAPPSVAEPVAVAEPPVAIVPPPAPPEAALPEAPVGDNDFTKQIDDWVEQDLAPSSRKLSPLPKGLADAAKPRPANVASKPKAAARSAKADWPRGPRSETYMQRFWRTSAKRAAIAAALFVCVNGAWLGASRLVGALSAPAMPAAPAAPEKALLSLALPQAPAVASAEEPSAAGAQAASTDYLVAVGLFASSAHADQLVDTLTQAGLPAMQRSLQFREKEVQQIVLGPFFSRADAMADLRRLQALGGYNDASVVESGAGGQ